MIIKGNKVYLTVNIDGKDKKCVLKLSDETVKHYNKLTKLLEETDMQPLIKRLRKPQASELPPKSTSQAVCQRCWKGGKIKEDCPDCKGKGKQEP